MWVVMSLKTSRLLSFSACSRDAEMMNTLISITYRFYGVFGVCLGSNPNNKCGVMYSMQ